MKQRFQQLTFHPFLFALYPPLFLLQHNLHEVDPISGLRGIIVSLLFSILLLLFCRLIFGSWQRAALVTTLFLIMFFSYGHVRALLPDIRIASLPIASHRYMYVFWLALITLLIWWAGWKVKQPERLTLLSKPSR